MEERDDDTAQIEARRFSDPTLEALRVQRDAYAASEGGAAVIYDKLRDEIVVAKQHLSDQEKVLATARYHLDLRAARGETLVQPPNRAGAIEAVCKELDEAEQQGAIPAAEPQTIR
jgi:hypothetical protein